MTTETERPELPLAIVGDVIGWHGTVRVVREKCCDPAATFAFFCLVCRCQIPNLYHLELHVETPGPHNLARVCKFHDLETI